MATRTRKTTITSKSAAPAPKRRRATKPAARRGARTGGSVANFFVPLFFIFCILFCLGFLGFMGYRTVTASEFFDVRKIDVRGISHTSKDDIQKLVSTQTEKSGVWNADLTEIKDRVEKLAFVKSAAVSRVLPDGVRVNIIERVPKAVVRFDAGDFWADEDGVILSLIGKNEQRPPFALTGWDESKTDKALKDNQERVKIYQKMLDDWQNFDLAKRVDAVDLKDLRTPQAIVQDSGETVTIILARDNFTKKLKDGLENTAGRGRDIASIDVSDVKPVLVFRKKTDN